MNYPLILLSALTSIVAGCSSNSQLNVISEDATSLSASCPEPVMTMEGVTIPGFADLRMRSSRDMKKLLYLRGTSIGIIDLATKARSVIDLQTMLPSPVLLIGIGSALWCPYNSNRILVQCATLTDTTGSQRRGVYGQNLYVVDLESQRATRITPARYGIAGASRGIGIHAWLVGSSEGTDSIHGHFSTTSLFEDGMSGEAVYVPQTGSLLRDSTRHLNTESRKGDHFVGIRFENGVMTVLLDGRPLTFDRSLYAVEHVSWLSDDRTIALSVDPGEGQGGRAIWLIDVETAPKSEGRVVAVKVIDLRRLHCLYSRYGSFAEATSDTTLAVSVHRDTDRALLLWEIDLNGRIIGPLTFLQ